MASGSRVLDQVVGGLAESLKSPDFMHATTSILPTPPAPQLPEFKTLLIQGDYPISSPFHLCLSYMLNTSASDSARRPRPLLVTAMSRPKIIEGLIDLNDDWLVANAGLGTTAGLLSELRIYYPSTPDHWMLLFSLFQNGVLENLETSSPNPSIYLESPVSLVVLLEPSSYLLNHDSPGSFTVSSYVRLIISALASLSFLDRGTGPPRLVVFDSRLHELSLPIFPIAGTDSGDEEDGEEHRGSRQCHKVSLAVERYFEWIGTVTRSSLSDSPTRHLTGSRYRMCLSPSQYSQEESIVWEWHQTRGHSQQRTMFQWT